jgi:signal transduction histidine kinase
MRFGSNDLRRVPEERSAGLKTEKGGHNAGVPVGRTSAQAPLRWFRSFYWRIAISFVLVMLAMIVAQSVMFSYMFARWNAQDPSRSPRNVAAAVAADVGAELEAHPGLDVAAHLQTHYGRGPYGVFVVMRDGGVAGNGIGHLPPEVLRAAQASLAGLDPARGVRIRRLAGPVVTAPLLVGGAVEGLVVLPSRRGGVLPTLQRWLSWPGTIILVGGTILAAVIVFAPARRRLKALEHATEQIGHGNLDVRAPEDGVDEIARVAQAFNRMARELAGREEALRASDRMRRQMLADVSHELKTPLTSIRAYVETLQMPEIAGDAERRARYFDTIAQQTRRLDRIVSDLLDLARYENGVSTLEPRVFSVARLFEQVAGRHERDAATRSVTIETSVEPAADQLFADPHRIDQAIDNLVANALRHTSGGGRIVLSAARVGDEVRLSVGDTGEGIAPEHVAHVFDRFYKVDPSRPGGTAGSGLGLSIVKAIVERHGGTVGVASAPGHTEFTIALPGQAAATGAQPMSANL